MKRTFFLLTLLCALVVSGLSPERSQAQQPPNLDLVRVFIDLPTRPTLTDRFLINNVGGNLRWEFATSNTISVELPQVAVDALSRVSSRFFNIRVEPTATAVGSINWGVDQINAEQVWGGAENAVNVTGNGGAGQSVAVIDTGISSHVDLTIAGGRNFVANPDNGSYSDDNGHGTHVAGTIAARDNGTGLIGVAPQASIYALKVLNAQGNGSYGDIIKAVEWATGLDGGTKVDVINMSLGCFSATNPTACHDPALQAAIDNAYNAGVLVVVAAGNNGPNANTVGYPGMYNSAIAVAATDSNNNVASFSSRGSKVELAAPGVSIQSTSRTGGYATMSGTSMATPHVAGLAALVKAANPSMTPAQLRARLQQTATDLGSAGRDSSYGYGLVNAVAAVGGTTPPPPPPPPPGAAFQGCTSQAAVTSSAGDNNGYQGSPSNACNDNSVFATDTNSGTSTSTSCTSTAKDKHLFYNFNTGVNGGATIDGIEVRLDARADSSFSSPAICVQLSWDGGASWTTAKQTSNLSTSEQTYILGSGSDTWGRSWTSSQLSNASFRVRVINRSSSTSRDFSLDWVAVRVTSSGGGTPVETDTTPPTVTSTSPAANATGVGTSSPVTATFSEPMDPASITGSSFTVRPTSGGGNLAGDVSYSGNVATFTPSAAYALNTSYTATVTTGVLDASGNSMTTARTWSFTTVQGSQDTGSPTVTGMTPANGVTGVAANSTIRATFSEAMNEASVETSGRFAVRVTNGGANVAGTVVYANNVATFTPSSPLAANTNYTVTLSTSMTDAAGNALTLPGSWTFTTAAAAASCTAPAIDSRSDTSTSGGGTVTFSWDPVPGATSYRIQRLSYFWWTTIATVSTTSYSGADAANDPQWRVQVAGGTCTPMPGPFTTFDP